MAGVTVDFRVVGPVEAVERDRVVAAGSTREGLLLADLLVHIGEVVPSARLIEDLWRGDPPAGAAATCPPM